MKNMNKVRKLINDMKLISVRFISSFPDEKDKLQENLEIKLEELEQELENLKLI